MSEKKRKAQTDENGQSKRRSSPIAVTKSKIKVRYHENTGLARPVIGISISLSRSMRSA